MKESTIANAKSMGLVPEGLEEFFKELLADCKSTTQNQQSDTIFGLDCAENKPGTSKGGGLTSSPKRLSRPVNIWEDYDDDDLADDEGQANSGDEWNNSELAEGGWYIPRSRRSTATSKVSSGHRRQAATTTQRMHLNALDEAEQLIQRLKAAEEADLINLNASVNNLVVVDDDENEFDSPIASGSNINGLLSSPNGNGVTVPGHVGERSAEEGVNPSLLPRCAIIYDYTIQPVVSHEQKRQFLPHFGTSSSPFLRPIVIDGVGLVKAYRNCCCTNTTYFPFPMVPIIRCMFYWISKGHSTVLCFPSLFNPLEDGVFNANSTQKMALQRLRHFKMCTIFETTCEEDNKKWYSNVLEYHRACLITTVSQWHLAMPNNLTSGVMTRSDGFSNGGSYGYRNRSILGDRCPERLLQPFFSHEGKLVFFSSFSAQGDCVADMILESTVMSPEDFEKFDGNQLSFLEQARMLKVLYDYVPETSRFRETGVMVKILQRLKPFLP